MTSRRSTTKPVRSTKALSRKGRQPPSDRGARRNRSFQAATKRRLGRSTPSVNETTTTRPPGRSTRANSARARQLVCRQEIEQRGGEEAVEATRGERQSDRVARAQRCGGAPARQIAHHPRQIEADGLPARHDRPIACPMRTASADTNLEDPLAGGQAKRRYRVGARLRLISRRAIEPRTERVVHLPRFGTRARRV